MIAMVCKQTPTDLQGKCVAGSSEAAAGVSSTVSEVLGAAAREFCALPALVPVAGV